MIPPARRLLLAAGLAGGAALTAGSPGALGAAPVRPPAAPAVVAPAQAAVPANYHTGSDTAWSRRITPGATQRLTRGLVDIRAFCASLPDPLYRIDCLADGLDQWSRNIERGSEYGEARAIVWEASRQLAAAARQYRDTARAPRNFRSTALPRRTARAIAPIRPGAQGQANRAGSAIIAEAETRLLRSAEQSQRRQVAFQEFSTALGSSKVLLRSA